jgi:hypothetical protein
MILQPEVPEGGRTDSEIHTVEKTDFRLKEEEENFYAITFSFR